MKTSLTIGLGIAISLAYSTQSMALSSDRDQPAQIQADDTEVDFRTGVRTLTNNVLLIQGTLRVKADKLVGTYNKQGDLVKAVANGSLARFKQRPDDQPDDVEGWAKQIVFDYPTNTVTLTGKAALKQGESTATGNKIVYNMATDKLRIVGDSTVNTAGKPGSNKPQKKIKDPFSDDSQGPAVTTKKPSTSTATKESVTEAKTEAEQLAPATVPSGRSRLIIKPKKK